MAFNLTLRKSFLYIFATVGLVLSIIGAVSLIDLGLKSYVFTRADNYCSYQVYPQGMDKNGNAVAPTQDQVNQQNAQCEEQRSANHQSQASTALALLIVGLPLYIYHWFTIRKENQV